MARHLGETTSSSGNNVKVPPRKSVAGLNVWTLLRVVFFAEFYASLLKRAIDAQHWVVGIACGVAGALTLSAYAIDKARIMAIRRRRWALWLTRIWWPLTTVPFLALAWIKFA
jgi:fluoride ion exporter CrcB/FEX